MTVDPSLAAAAIAGLIGCAALLAIVYGPWQRLCTDYARDVVLEQRDALFDIAVTGRLSFGSVPYETIRSALNALIRLAPGLTLFELVPVVLASRRARPPQPRSEVRAALGLIPDGATRDEVSRLVGKAEKAVLAMVLLRSPCFVILGLVPFTVVTAFRGRMKGALALGALTGQIENAISAETQSSPR